jgi:hypothetical protein
MTTITGAVLQKEFIEYTPLKAASHSLFFNYLSSATINRHGCELQAEGASLTASRHVIIFSRSTPFIQEVPDAFSVFYQIQNSHNLTPMLNSVLVFG